MKTIKTNKLEFYGDGRAEVIINKTNNSVNIEITETNGLGIVGVELTIDQARQLTNQLNKLIQEVK